MDKIIFLDIDGVLNDHRKLKNGYCGIRRRCVGHFNSLIKRTEARVVIVSAWRYMMLAGSMTETGFWNMLMTHGVTEKLKIAGFTRSDEDVTESRAAQVDAWLSDHCGGRPRFVVIDDMDLGYTRHKHPFVQTVPGIGLTKKDADEACALLGEG